MIKTATKICPHLEFTNFSAIHWEFIWVVLLRYSHKPLWYAVNEWFETKLIYFSALQLQYGTEFRYGVILISTAVYSAKMIYPHSKDKLPSLTTSMVAYSFVCSCSANHIGRTTRQLATRVKEHKPAWLRSASIKNLSSATVTHLAETGHTADVGDCFKILYRVPLNRSKAVCQQILATAEAVAQKLTKPTLYSQKKCVKALKLPWPDTQTSPNPTQRPED